MEVCVFVVSNLLSVNEGDQQLFKVSSKEIVPKKTLPQISFDGMRDSMSVRDL